MANAVLNKEDNQAIDAPTVAASQRESLPFVPVIVAVLLCTTLLLVSFGICWAKFSRAEVFFAESAREMIANNNLVTPLYHNKPFFDKPILVYWLIISMFKSFGVSHFVARIPSMIAALATIATTAFIGKRLAQTQKNATGIVAAMVLASSFMFFSFSYLCMSDIFLVLFDTITLALFYAGANNQPKRNLLWWLASVSMGLAFVTKGPIGIVLPGIAAIAYLAITKQLRSIRPVHVVVAAITVCLIAVPWFYAAYQANGTWALAYFFIRENFERYAGGTYDTHKPVYFMLVSLLTGFLPWSIFLPGAFVDFIGDCKSKFQTPQSKQRLLLWLWTALVTGFFSVSRGKIDYYVLPVYPAVALLVAWHLTSRFGDRLPRTLALISSVVFLAAGVASPVLLSTIAAQAGFADWWMMPSALVVCSMIALAGACQKQCIPYVMGIFTAICFAGSGFAWQMIPVLNQSQSFGVYASAMRAVPMSTQVAVHNSLGHWVDELTFQVERDPVELSDSASIAKLFLAGPALALIPEERFQQAVSENPDLSALSFKIVDRRQVASHPLTPGYVLKRKGQLLDTTLLLITND